MKKYVVIVLDAKIWHVWTIFLVILLCSESDNRIGNYYFLFALLQIDKYTQVLLYYSKINIQYLLNFDEVYRDLGEEVVLI